MAFFELLGSVTGSDTKALLTGGVTETVDKTKEKEKLDAEQKAEKAKESEAAPPEIATLVEYVPAGMPLRTADSASVVLDRPASVPDDLLDSFDILQRNDNRRRFHSCDSLAGIGGAERAAGVRACAVGVGAKLE